MCVCVVKWQKPSGRRSEKLSSSAGSATRVQVRTGPSFPVATLQIFASSFGNAQNTFTTATRSTRAASSRAGLAFRTPCPFPSSTPDPPPTYRTATAVPQLELLLLCPIFSVFISSPFASFPLSPLPLFPFSSLPFPSLPLLVPLLLLLLLRLLPVFFDPCIDIFFACVKNFANFITVIWYAPFGHAHTLTKTRTHTDWHTQTHTHANAGQISKQHGQVQVITVNFVCVKVLLFLPIPCKLHHRWGSMH